MKLYYMSMPAIGLITVAIILSTNLAGQKYSEHPMANEKPTTMTGLSPESTYLIVRTDDIGMSHSVNMGIEKLVKTGIPLSTSIMFVCPWYREAVEVLKNHPQVSVGVHLTLNSEWKNYRWGPVAGAGTVPSLVDADGYFFHSAEELWNNHPKMSEIETELRAQIERAIHSGLKIDYLDYHMGTVTEKPEVMAIVEKLAHQYHLGLAQYFGEMYHSSQYRAAVDHKLDSLVTTVKELKPGFNVIVAHVGLDNPELHSMIDMNDEGGLSNMAENRQAVLNALLSYRFQDAIKENDIKLINYGELIKMKGLKSMKKPDEF
ncbi:MAG TPA: ChbG/HpnK family deacetylase [Balneolales bacterium]|nr:ChbG/HpnK family deacetylase [Balneolales bacterium]